MQFTVGRDRRQHVVAASSTGDRDLRGLPHRAPGVARPIHDPHPGLILKRDIGPDLLGKLLDDGKFNLQKICDLFGIPFLGSIARRLTAQLHPVQMQTHRGFRHLNPVVLFE